MLGKLVHVHIYMHGMMCASIHFAGCPWQFPSLAKMFPLLLPNLHIQTLPSASQSWRIATKVCVKTIFRCSCARCRCPPHAHICLWMRKCRSVTKFSSHTLSQSVDLFHINACGVLCQWEAYQPACMLKKACVLPISIITIRVNRQIWKRNWAHGCDVPLLSYGSPGSNLQEEQLQPQAVWEGMTSCRDDQASMQRVTEEWKKTTIATMWLPLCTYSAGRMRCK